MAKDIDDPRGPEAAIQNAMERGDFEDLKGKGKPLDLNDYFETPEENRLGYTLLKNAGFVPEEVQLLNLISELKEKIRKTKDKNDLMTMKKQLRDTQLKYDLLMDRLHKR